MDEVFLDASDLCGDEESSLALAEALRAEIFEYVNHCLGAILEVFEYVNHWRVI